MVKVSKVCLISPAEESAWLHNRIRPNCREHLHCSQREAKEWTSQRQGFFRPHTRPVLQMGSHVRVTETQWLQGGAAHFVEHSSGRMLVIELLHSPEPKNSGGVIVLQWVGVPSHGGGPRTYSSNGWPDVLITESMRKQ
jgi:hypothetical protein